MIYDAIVIGGGVTGSAIARYLSRYDISLALLEKDSDVCTCTSKANSGIVHAGHDPIPGTEKARLNVKGNKMIRELAKSLDLDLVNNGALVISFDSDSSRIEELYQRGCKNGVEGMRILSHDEVLALEPNINPEVTWALHLSTSCVVCPFSLTIALCENAIANGLELFLSHEVLDIKKKDEYFEITSNKETFNARCVINAAGVYADRINNMVSSEKEEIIPRRGEYVLLDKSEGKLVKSTIFQLPTKAGKGVLVTPTAHGNILVGPDSITVDDKENTATESFGLESVMENAKLSVPSINYRAIITSFAGVRAQHKDGDFILTEPEDGFFNALAIDSPGLTASVAIGEELSDRVASKLNAKKKNNFIEERKGIVKASLLSNEDRNKLIQSDPSYGNIICRCEEISEGEIKEAVRRGATTLDGVKRRVRAGMGRCQGGFCSPKVMEIIARETALDMKDVRKNEVGSEVIQ